MSLKPGTFLDHNMDEIPFSDFINKELILFSMADNIRSIPSVADGLKPGQRKVIWGCFKRNLKKEIKVYSLHTQLDEKDLLISRILHRLHNSSVTSQSRLSITTEKRV
jgi:two-component sensor histidine kinase